MEEPFKRYINMLDNGDGTMTVVTCLEEGEEITMIAPVSFQQMIETMPSEIAELSYKLMGDIVVIPDNMDAC